MNKLLQKQEYKKSLNLTLKLLKEGNSMPEIAYKRKLAFSTIETHLGRLIEEGKINVDGLLDKNKIELIKKAIGINESLKEIKSKLPEEVTYGEIKYVLTSLGRFKSKKSLIESDVNTYAGNYCYRKCFNHWDIVSECGIKFDKLVKEIGDTKITFKELKEMIDNDEIKICRLPLEKRKRYVSWKYFEYLKEINKDFWEDKNESNQQRTRENL